jgi:putative FmdB family regulatory protein
VPIFEYLCEECSDRFEKLVGREEQIECPVCHSQQVVKQYSRFGMAGSSSKGTYESLPLYKGGGCGCTASSCGCKN